MKFDLNIEEILADWGVHHAIREIIANAFDERLLTGTPDVRIFEDDRGRWHIRDFGRGLRAEHFTQNENEEKVGHPHVIGKFGIGLKDACATFHRHSVDVAIRSQYGVIRLAVRPKAGFEGIETLHAIIDSRNADTSFRGTDVRITGATRDDMEQAKRLFRRFSGETAIETTSYGTILQKTGDAAHIYINGVKVADEPDFLFSYDITSLTTKLRKALNRERDNVGRTAYSDRVRAILLDARSETVARSLVDDLTARARGTAHDELNWVDVQSHALKILNATNAKTIFLTADELIANPEVVDEACSAGREIVTIPDNLRERVAGEHDANGNPIRDLTEFRKEYDQSFQFHFVAEDDLDDGEQDVFAMRDRIFELVGGRPQAVRKVAISENMKREGTDFSDRAGCWIAESGMIVLRRDQLRSTEEFCGVLLHEAAHAATGLDDVTREFESALSRYLGQVAAWALSNGGSSGRDCNPVRGNAATPPPVFDTLPEESEDDGDGGDWDEDELC